MDRVKDMINVSGFKVFPREVEEVLFRHPAVREAAVLGMPDRVKGEAVLPKSSTGEILKKDLRGQR